MLDVYKLAKLFLVINTIVKKFYYCFRELNEIRLRGFFLEPTVPDLGNSSGGMFIFKYFSPHLEI